MTVFGKTVWAALALVPAIGRADDARAQSAPTDIPAVIEISANIGVVSDYRFRGISLSGRDPAIQGGIDVTTASGFFVGTWASNVANTGGSHMELDLYGGYAGSAGGLDYSAKVLGYVYPGGHGVNYVELAGTLGKAIGPAAFEAQVSYVPDQDNYGYDNLYLGAKVDVALPSTPLTLRLRGGRESNPAFTKWDWEAGLSWSHGPLTASLSYIDSDYGGEDEAGRLGRGAIVASLLASF